MEVLSNHIFNLLTRADLYLGWMILLVILFTVFIDYGAEGKVNKIPNFKI